MRDETLRLTDAEDYIEELENKMYDLEAEKDELEEKVFDLEKQLVEFNTKD
jgi:predicted  nucleic acid-binding Zn-ribbon protein